MLQELESSMQMNLLTMKKRSFCCLFIVFIGMFVGLVFLAAIRGPAPIEFHYTLASTKGLDMSSNLTRFNWQINELDKLNQQLYFNIRLVNSEYASNAVAGSLNVSLALRGSLDGETWEYLTGTAAKPFVSEVRQVDCPQGTPDCNNVTLVHEPFLHYAHYQVDVTFLDGYKFDWIEDVWFEWVTVSHGYTLFELWFRFGFLLASFIAVFVYSFRLRKFAYREWTIEQKWIAIMLFFLMGFNNPFFPLDILVDSPIPPFLDALFISSFLVAVMLFWLSIFDSIRKTKRERSFGKFYLPKLVLMFILWVATVTVFTWQELHELDNPAYSTPDDIEGFVFFRVVMLVLLLVYVFWLIYVVIRAMSDRKKVPFLDVRLKFLAVMTFVIIALVVMGIVGGIVSNQRNNAAQFLSIWSLFNLYIFVLAIVYSPSGSAYAMHRDAERRTMIPLDDNDSRGEDSYSSEGFRRAVDTNAIRLDGSRSTDGGPNARDSRDGDRDDDMVDRRRRRQGDSRDDSADGDNNNNNNNNNSSNKKSSNARGSSGTGAKRDARAANAGVTGGRV